MENHLSDGYFDNFYAEEEANPMNFATGDCIWNGEEAFMENTSQVSCSSLQYDIFDSFQVPAESSAVRENSAFVMYKRECRIGVKAGEMKQKSFKRCLSFLRTISKSGRLDPDHVMPCQTNSAVDDKDFASSHMMAERNRRSRLNQHFLALRSVLSYNSKKSDQFSLLSNAKAELNQLKLRIAELEQRNETLTNTLMRNIADSSSGLLRDCGNLCGGAGASATDCVSDEAVVLIEESAVPERANMQATFKRIACSHADAIVALLTLFKNLNLEVLRIQSKDLGCSHQSIQATIRKRTREEGWQTYEKKVEDVLKQTSIVDH